MVAIDPEGAKGAELKEFDAHRFLEKNTEALTWNDMRNALKELDIDYDKKVGHWGSRARPCHLSNLTETFRRNRLSKSRDTTSCA